MFEVRALSAWTATTAESFPADSSQRARSEGTATP